MEALPRAISGAIGGAVPGADDLEEGGEGLLERLRD